MPSPLIHLRLFNLLVILGGTRALAIEPIAILAPDDCDNNDFGDAVAISGDYIAVGAPRDPCYNGDATGAVYVFRRLGPTWNQVAKLTAPDGGWPDQLGYSVAIEGDVVVAGASKLDRESLHSSGPGAVYVFRRNDNGTPDNPWDDSWPFEAKLLGPTPERGQILGWSVAISGNVVVAGEPGTGDTAEVFRRKGSGWVHEISLTGSNMQLGNNFGASVDIDFDRIVVDAPWHAPRSAFVFRYAAGNWIEEQVLTPSEITGAGDRGRSVGIRGSTITLGSSLTNGTTLGEGAAYAFVLNPGGEWIEQAKMTASDASRYEHLGAGVSVDVDFILAGRRGHPWGILFNQVGTHWVEKEKLFGIEGGFAFAVAMEGNHAVVITHVYAVRNRRDLGDYGSVQRCFGHEGEVVPCAAFDLTMDGVVDVRDFEEFMSTFSGP